MVESTVAAIVGLVRLIWKELAHDADGGDQMLAERGLMEFSARLAEECRGVPREVSDRIAEQWWRYKKAKKLKGKKAKK